jgi:citrate lyase subunit beta/citryl-CoA lyase
MNERSYLFVPGNRAERFDKARASAADAVIFDLEDAVQPQEKPSARDSVLGHMDAVRPAFVRINAAGTPWVADDIAALANHPGVAGIVLPKAETREQIETVLEHAQASLKILPIVETAFGFANLTQLCAAPRVERILFGTLDFQIDLNVEGDGEELHMFRSQIVLASRLAGLAAPVDGVSTVLDDAAAIEFEARRGRRFGYGAKLCIHPKQIAAVHRAYAWTSEEQAWAARVLQAVEASGGAAIAVDGKMVDMPVILKARRIAGVQ